MNDSLHCQTLKISQWAYIFLVRSIFRRAYIQGSPYTGQKINFRNSEAVNRIITRGLERISGNDSKFKDLFYLSYH